ncbi:hypothetical protein H5410_050774 [Solanum commersonii]|uniref:Uncharacterized protein n=1 Tax=Solanum commersonii TaxID=4109 RepID=A0A9J5WWH0_SOLCO|nr:hypothetical protein H5410_050774 [Solanum commersonii]
MELAPRLGIKIPKATLNFMAKLFWLLVHNRVSPTKADNQVTWDKAGHSCKDRSEVEIDFCPRALDIGLIRDEANVAKAPPKEPQVKVPPLGVDLANIVG